MSGEFYNARYNGAVKVITDQEEQIRKLEKQLKQLQSEFNVLKKTHMDVINDCIDKKQALRKRNQKLKDDYNKLLEREQNKGWNEL